MAATPVLITIPKYISISTPSPKNPIPVRPALHPTSVQQQQQQQQSAIDEFLVLNGSAPKKRRLDHLTWEEKFQRKKLKNRVAAQTSRDRKKAKMDDMERMIQTISDENDALKERFNMLTTENVRLNNRNEELEQKLIELQKRLDESLTHKTAAAAAAGAGAAGQTGCAVGCNSNIQNGSAVSDIFMDPLPQGLESQTTTQLVNSITNNNNNSNNQKKNSQESVTLWKIIALCLLYKSCSTTSMPAVWKNWPKICLPMSSQTLQKMLTTAMKEMPKYKAPQSDCLDQWWGPKQKQWTPPKISTTV